MLRAGCAGRQAPRRGSSSPAQSPGPGTPSDSTQIKPCKLGPRAEQASTRTSESLQRAGGSGREGGKRRLRGGSDAGCRAPRPRGGEELGRGGEHVPRAGTGSGSLCKGPQEGRRRGGQGGEGPVAAAACRAGMRPTQTQTGGRGGPRPTLELWLRAGAGEAEEGKEGSWAVWEEAGARDRAAPGPHRGPPRRSRPSLASAPPPLTPGPHAATRSPRLRPPCPSRPLSSASPQTLPPPSSARRRDTAQALH